MNTSNSLPADPIDNGRDGRGRFTAGNRGGPGNPYARRVARLRSIIVESLTDEAMHEIVDQLIVVARLGNMTAIKFLFQYALGKPAPVQSDPDKVDLQEIEMLKKSPTVQELGDTAHNRFPPDVLLEAMRVGQEANGLDFRERLLDGIQEIDERQAAAQAAEAEAEVVEPPVAERPRPQRAPSPNGGRREVGPSPNGETRGPTANGHAPSSNGKRPPYGNGEHGGNGHNPNPRPTRR